MGINHGPVWPLDVPEAAQSNDDVVVQDDSGSWPEKECLKCGKQSTRSNSYDWFHLRQGFLSHEGIWDNESEHAIKAVVCGKCVWEFLGIEGNYNHEAR